MTDPRRSLASPLAALYWLLVIYASLHPFTDWSVPPLTPGELLRLPQWQEVVPCGGIVSE